MLDQDQLNVASRHNGYYACYAGPGSGKSTTLLYRVASLPVGDKILCVTFTNEAAKSLRTRCGKEFPHVNTDCFSTLHSLALKFAYKHADAFPFPVSDNPLAVDGAASRAVFEATQNKINYTAFTSWVSLQKRKRISPAEAVRESERSNEKVDYAIAYKKYQASLKRQGILDFDDLIYFMVEILETRPDIRAEWQYDYVMMDEAQDACELDWRLLQLITERRRNFMAVGDAGQAIYGFRGGVPDHFLSMEAFFPGTQKIYLGNNYRSTRNIVSYVRKAAPYEDISEHFKAVRDRQGAELDLCGYSTDYMEATDVVRKIAIYGPESCAVLCRTNLGLRAIEEECLNQEVKYHILGDSGFWEANEIQNVLYYVRCAYMLTDNAVLGALKAPFWPSKYLKKKQVKESIEKVIGNKTMSAYSALTHIPGVSQFKDFIRGLGQYQHQPPAEAISNVLRELNAVAYYKEEECVSPDHNPVANLKELVRVAGRYESLKDFLDFVRKTKYASGRKTGVCLSTIHSAKGKEWPNVFVVAVNEGILPHAKSENLDEEKCCWFTAVSRAEESLHVSYYGTPSVFLAPFLKQREEEYDRLQVNETTEERDAGAVVYQPETDSPGWEMAESRSDSD
jgi:DNA helicase-2/ATP-dependent DNA helicase PcrA